MDRLAPFTALLIVAACSAPMSAAPAAPASGAAYEVVVTLATGSPAELAARAQLERLLTVHDLSRWTRQREVVIEQGAAPHSHPVVTLNTRYTDDDDWALSVFVHEQGHWHFTGRREAVSAATADLDSLFADAPSDRETGGARSKRDTLLHLMVCLLEYDAMVSLIGAERTRALFARKDYYLWIYMRVVSDRELILAVMQAHRLDDY